MKLMTKKIEKDLEKYPIYSQDGKKGEADVICKFFFGAYTWYVLEGHKIENDYEFFGIIEYNGEREYGYFYLSQLASVKYMGYPCVERDLYFDKCKVKDI